jgi:hypothetical protein
MITTTATDIHIQLPAAGVIGSPARPMFAHIAEPAHRLDPRDVYSGMVEATDTGIACGICSNAFGPDFHQVRHATLDHVRVCSLRVHEMDALDELERRAHPYI